MTAPNTVVLTLEPLPPRYGVRSAELQGEDGRPLYLAGLLTEEARREYLARAGLVVVESGRSAA